MTRFLSALVLAGSLSAAGRAAAVCFNNQTGEQVSLQYSHGFGSGDVEIPNRRAFCMSGLISIVTHIRSPLSFNSQNCTGAYRPFSNDWWVITLAKPPDDPNGSARLICTKG